MVVMPYVDGMLSDALLRVVRLSGYPYLLCQLDRADLGAYGRLVRRLWSQPTDVVIVEQDVVPTLTQLKELSTCGHDWCGFNYDGSVYPDGPMFGCVRLSRRLMVRHPYAAEIALTTPEPGRGTSRLCDDARARAQQGSPWTPAGERQWWAVDNAMARDLMIRGERWQAHAARVHHAHAGPPSGP